MSARNTTTILEGSNLVTFKDLRTEFDALDKHLKSQFNSQYEFHRDRHQQVTSEIQELSRKVLDFIQESRAFSQNRLATRPFHTILKLRTTPESMVYFPKTVAKFYKLKTYELASLLKAYEFTDFEAWEEYGVDGETVEQSTYELKTYPSDKSPLEIYVEQYPFKAHSTLAGILGLDYGTIEKEMKTLEQAKARVSTGRKNKRPEADDDTSIGPPIKYTSFVISDNSSLTEEVARGPVETYTWTKQSAVSSGESSDS